MGKRRVGKRRAWLLGLLALAGCPSPDPQTFRLVATKGAPTIGAAMGGGPAKVMLRRPGIAGYLDRPEIVRSGGGVRLAVDSGQRWGEPFGDMVGRVLAEDLSRRLPGTSVYTEAGSISADPDATLEVDVQRFDADPNGDVALSMQASVARSRNDRDGAPAVIRLNVHPASSATADVVTAMSAALGQAADQIAATLRSQPPAEPPRPRR